MNDSLVSTIKAPIEVSYGRNRYFVGSFATLMIAIPYIAMIYFGKFNINEKLMLVVIGIISGYIYWSSAIAKLKEDERIEDLKFKFIHSLRDYRSCIIHEFNLKMGDSDYYLKEKANIVFTLFEKAPKNLRTEFLVDVYFILGHPQQSSDSDSSARLSAQLYEITYKLADKLKYI